jgi:hypothetical protein
VRLYLALAFAGVALITAGLAYLLVSQTGTEEADDRLDEIASGRTARLAGEVGNNRPGNARAALDVATEEGYAAWVFDLEGRVITPRASTWLTSSRRAAPSGRRWPATSSSRSCRAATRSSPPRSSVRRLSTGRCSRVPPARPSSRRRSRRSAGTG